SKLERLCCPQFLLSTAGQLPSRLLLIPWSGAFSIKSACPTRALIAGAMTRQNLPGNVENHRLAGSLADRARISAAANLGAHIALRNRRSPGCCRKTGQ